MNSKVIGVTVRPEPKATESQLEIELAHITNVSTSWHARHMFFGASSLTRKSFHLLTGAAVVSQHTTLV